MKEKNARMTVANTSVKIRKAGDREETSFLMVK
jgi:hypothetical protein